MVSQVLRGGVKQEGEQGADEALLQGTILWAPDEEVTGKPGRREQDMLEGRGGQGGGGWGGEAHVGSQGGGEESLPGNRLP